MANQSYIRILQAIESFASEHLQVKKFASDFPAQIPNFGNKNENYPILFVSPSTSIFQANTNTFEIKVYCFDIINKDRRNINTILSDTNSVLNDLVLWMQYGELAGIDVMDFSSAIPINNSLLDYAAGWELTIILTVDRSSICDIPFNNVPAIVDVCNEIAYPKYLTCNGLDACPIITGITNDINILKNKPTGTVTGTGVTNYLSKWNSASGLTTSGVWNGGTNFDLVGIGTNNPRNVTNYANLTIEAMSGGSVHFRSSGSTDLGGLAFDINGLNVRTLQPALPILFTVNNSEKMRISLSGNVLINNTIESGNNEKLQVNGAALINGSTNIIGNLTATGTLTSVAHIISGNTAGSNSYIQLKAGGTNIAIFGSDASLTGGFSADVGTYIYNLADYFIITSNVKRLTVKGNGRILIGTTTDDTFRRLQVSGDTIINGQFLTVAPNSIFNFRSQTNGQNYGIFRTVAGADLAYLGDANGSAISGGSLSDFAVHSVAGALYNSAATNLIYRTNGQTRMFLSVGGNLLINSVTDDGVNKLQVNGSMGVNDGDIKRKNKTTDTVYNTILNNEIVIGARGGGTVPMIATRTSSTVATGMFLLGIQNADVIRTTESDIIFRTGFESSNTIQPLTTAGNAFSFQNSTTGLVHIFRNGNMLISTTTSIDNGVDKLQVVGSVKANQFKLNALNTAPTSSGDTGTLGEIRYDANFMYVCVATNQWKRSALTSW